MNEILRVFFFFFCLAASPDSGSAELREPHRHTLRAEESGGVRVRHTTLERSRARAPSNSNNGTLALRGILSANRKAKCYVTGMA